MKKRIIALFLVVVLSVMMLPVIASAENAETEHFDEALYAADVDDSGGLGISEEHVECCYGLNSESGDGLLIQSNAALIEGFSENLAFQSGSVLTEQIVYERIMAMKPSYPEGMPFTNETHIYMWRGGNNPYAIGLGCVAFAFIMSDAAFGDLQARVHYDINDIKIGDILRINNQTHSVIVIGRDSRGITIAEGNYNRSVHWGRTITWTRLQQIFNYAQTRYPPPASPFRDVSEDVTAFPAILWSYNNSIVTGTNDGRFLPKDNMTRDQYALVLWRYMGRPSPGAGRTFVDVPATDIAFNAISWASANGIVTGRGDSFLPKDNMTRAEMVLMMHRVSRLYGKNLSFDPNALNHFADREQIVPAAREAMLWGVTHGLITGRGSNLLPNDPVTREQVVLILYRYVHGIGA